MLRDERRFDTLALIGMDAVAVEKFNFLPGCGSPSLDEVAMVRIDSKLTLRADHLDRQRIEEFVGEDDHGNGCGFTISMDVATRLGMITPKSRHIISEVFIGRAQRRLTCFNVFAKSAFETLLECGRAFDQRIMQSVEEFREFLSRPVEHVLRKQAASRPKLQKHNLFRRPKHAPHLLKLAC